MSTEVLDYLKSKDVFYINLDGDGEPARRREEWDRQINPLFNSTSRVIGINGVEEITFDEARQFVTTWHDLWDDLGGREFSIANKPPGKNWRVNTAKANVAIMRSHVAAIQQGMKSTHFSKSFLVAEDDIIPRNSLRHEDVPLPPGDAHVAIWSGGLPMAGVGADSTKYERQAPHKWVEITKEQAFNSLGAGLYEMTPGAAMYIVDQVQKHPISFDHAWGFALRDLKVYRMTPQAFAQVGPSIRNGRDRAPVLDRVKR